MLKLLGLIKKNFGEDEVTLADKTIIWDLDNTLYRITPEFADMLDEATAIAAIEDLGVPLNFEEAKAKVKESYMTYRDGGEIFVQQYGIDPEAMFQAYHKRKPIAPIVPYENLLEKLESLPNEQYIFSTSTHEVCEKILKHIGLYDFFKGRFYSVEDFGTVKKNESSDVYAKLCRRINADPKNCIFVDDSYSNLEFAKELGMTTVRIFYNENSAKDKTYIDAAYKGINSFLDEYLRQVPVNSNSALKAAGSAVGAR